MYAEWAETADKSPGNKNDAGSGPSDPEASGRAVLAGALAARAKDRASAAERHARGAVSVDAALALVRGFVAERGLVVFGGMAIDAALAAAGAPPLYPPGQRPDYDLLSPRNVDDAYDLAEKLHGAGFGAVAVVRGVHVQTMRVRVDSAYVADFGYVPLAAFAALPVFEREGLRYLGAEAQRLDLHLALCFPYANAPREDVFHRWPKDLARFARLERAAPLGGASRATSYPALEAVRGVFGADVAAQGRPRAALHGFAAYAALRAALDEAAAAMGVAAECEAPRLRLAVDGAAVETEALAGVAREAALATPEPRAFAPPGARWFEPYLDAAPAAARAEGAAVYSTASRRLGVWAARAPGPAGDAGLKVFVVTPPYLLAYFAGAALRAPAAERPGIYAYYHATLDVVAAGARVFARARAAAPAAAAEVAAAFARSPFAPATDTLGGLNVAPALALRLAEDARYAGLLSSAAPPRDPVAAPDGAFREAAPEVAAQTGDESDLAAFADFAATGAGLPSNYRPATKARPRFDYGACRLYRRAGAPLDPAEAPADTPEGAPPPPGVPG